MNVSLLGYEVFGTTLDAFMITILVIILGLIAAGVILMARNVRPILGFLLLVFAIALIIGVSYDADAIKRSITKFFNKVTGSNIEVVEPEQEYLNDSTTKF